MFSVISRKSISEDSFHLIASFRIAVILLVPQVSETGQQSITNQVLNTAVAKAC